MIRVAWVNDSESREYRHSDGALEVGRGPRRDVPRCVILDPYVSRDHLLLEETDGGQLRITNISHTSPAVVAGQSLDTSRRCELPMPVQLRIGKTEMLIEVPQRSATFHRQSTATFSVQSVEPPGPPRSLQELGASPNVQTLAHWFETLIAIQQAAVGSTEFYKQTARAVVDLVGLDRGLVLLRQSGQWRVAAMEAASDHEGPSFSGTVLDEVLQQRRTFYQQFEDQSLRASLANVEAVVAAPILDKGGEVVGAVYGSRTRRCGQTTALIQPLEAQIVQVLAAAVGVGLARQHQEAEAVRAQVQFEQFFSVKLARELARDARMLEGREREITILFSDVRQFSALSEQLGPRDIFRVMQDVMELQSAIIREHDGVVVDYYGDGLLAMWNAPTEQPGHPAIACRAALQIIAGLPQINQSWQASLERPLNLGIGINTGPALVGNTGSKVKLKYGPMGHAVNVASRVENAVKHFGVSILLTGSTRAELDETFATRRIGRARLAGVAQPIPLFELSAEALDAGWRERRDAFERALDHFEAARWAEACQDLYPLLRAEEGRYDVPSLQLLARAVDCLKSPPKNFDPVFDLGKT